MCPLCSLLALLFLMILLLVVYGLPDIFIRFILLDSFSFWSHQVWKKKVIIRKSFITYLFLGDSSYEHSKSLDIMSRTAESLFYFVSFGWFHVSGFSHLDFQYLFCENVCCSPYPLNFKFHGLRFLVLGLTFLYTGPLWHDNDIYIIIHLKSLLVLPSF